MPKKSKKTTKKLELDNLLKYVEENYAYDKELLTRINRLESLEEG